MADIATLGIRVTSSGVKEATRDLDKLGAESKQTSKEVSSLGKTLAGLGVGFVAGRLIGAGLSAIIQNTIEAEQAQSQLAAVLKSTGGAAGIAQSQLNAMADSLAKVTVFDDEAITGAQSLLLTFTKIGKDVFPDATEAVLNMSQALGQDLKSSATQLGKALNDPIKGITALSRVGVAFTQSQKDLIESLVQTGRVADAQRIILGELTTEFGGSARAARDTLGGALQGLKNDFDNLLEGDGKGVEGTTAAIKELSATLNSAEVKAGFQSLIRGIAEATRLAALAIPTLVALKQQISDTYAADNQKSYLGLLQKESGLRAEIDDLEQRGANRITAPFSKNLGRTVADLKEQLKTVNALSEAQRNLGRAQTNAAASGGSSGPTGGRGRNAGGESLEAYRKRRAAEAEAAKDAAKDSKKTGSTRAAGLSDEQRAANSLAESYGRMNAQLKEEVALHGQTGKEATLAYQLKNGDLSKFTDKQKESLLLLARQIDQNEILDKARAKTIADEEAEATAIDAHKKAVDGLLSDIAFETKLLGLSNIEREKEIALRYAGARATDAERADIAKAIDLRESTAKQASGLEDLRQRGQDLFVDLTDGVGSWKDAFDDAISSFRTQMLKLIAEQLFKKLLPDSLATSTSGNGGGGLLAGIIGSFAGGRAIGGPVSGSKLYEVGERKPELLRMNGRQYLIPGKDGSVSSGAGASTTKNMTVNVTVPGNTSRETAAQVGARVAQVLQLSGRDN